MCIHEVYTIWIDPEDGLAEIIPQAKFGFMRPLTAHIYYTQFPSALPGAFLYNMCERNANKSSL